MVYNFFVTKDLTCQSLTTVNAFHFNTSISKGVSVDFNPFFRVFMLWLVDYHKGYKVITIHMQLWRVQPTLLFFSQFDKAKTSITA